jgi:hypothetical protein
MALLFFVLGGVGGGGGQRDTSTLSAQSEIIAPK